MIPRIRNWGVVHGNRSPFCPPEHAGIAVTGEIHDHPEQPDGKCITTSRIVEVESDGRTIHTVSGNRYFVDGDPAPEYLQALAAMGRAYDPSAPIRVIQRKAS